MANDNNGNGNDPKMSDLLRKLVSAGIGAAFMTEESIRNYVGEMKLPKDAVNFLLQGANKSKEELMNRVGNEVIKIINKIDFVKEASRFVEEHKFRISAEIDVVKKSIPGEATFTATKVDIRKSSESQD
jgi:hypothetical protein